MMNKKTTMHFSLFIALSFTMHMCIILNTNKSNNKNLLNTYCNIQAIIDKQQRYKKNLCIVFETCVIDELKYFSARDADDISSLFIIDK